MDSKYAEACQLVKELTAEFDADRVNTIPEHRNMIAKLIQVVKLLGACVDEQNELLSRLIVNLDD